MTTSNSGAVFFLGTRAHYQVLQQPESRYDVENGNATTDTVNRNHAQLWKDREDWRCDDNATEEKEKQEISTVGVKRRTKRHSSENALCDNEMKPALLNNIGDSDTPKSKPSRRRMNLLTFLANLARRKRSYKLDSNQIHYLQHLESALNNCTYRESCRCLECQSRYFDCDESEDGYSSDEEYTPQIITRVESPSTPEIEEEDDEVFVDTVPDDNTSTDMLINGHDSRKVTTMSVSSDECTETDANDALDLEVAAGTPVLLNYLLTHPITCTIQ